MTANRGGPPEIISDKLQNRHLASLVDPIQVTKSGEVVEADIYPYEMRLAKAIVHMLSKKTTIREQNQIGDTVPSWEDVYIRRRQAYNQSILDRLEY